MAKFRNIVVHHYDKVDAEIVVGVMKKDLKDFIGYKQAIVDFLKSEAESERENDGRGPDNERTMEDGWWMKG